MITELSRWRAESGLTQLAAARALGVSQTYFSLLERGARPMTDGLRRRLGAVRSGRLRERVGDSAGVRSDGVSEAVLERDYNHEREQAHVLLDLLAPTKLSAVRQLLEFIAEQAPRLD